jgi:hypothetical protein
MVTRTFLQVRNSGQKADRSRFEIDRPIPANSGFLGKSREAFFSFR